jgi:hypothetical protein
VRTRLAGWTLWQVLLTWSSGCSSSLFRREAPAEDVDFARRYMVLFQSRAYPAIEMGMDPTIRDPQIRAKIVQMASAFPQGEPKSVQVIASTARVSGDTTTSTLSFQYEYPSRWVLADVVIERKGQAPVVKGVHVQPMREPVDRLNRFTFAGKRPVHFAALATVGLVLLLVGYAAVLAIRTPAPSMQWAWVIVVFLGVGQFAFNWTTGAITLAPMTVHVFGSGLGRASIYEPVRLTTSLPVGAIVYLIQRREWRRRPAQPDSD